MQLGTAGIGNTHFSERNVHHFAPWSLPRMAIYSGTLVYKNLSVGGAGFPALLSEGVLAVLFSGFLKWGLTLP